MKYTITDIRQRSKEIKGKREIYVRVFYKTDKAYEGSVDINKHAFSEKEARKAIEREIMEIKRLLESKEVDI